MKRTLGIALALIFSLAFSFNAFAARTADLTPAEIYGDEETLEFLGWELDGSTAKFLPTAGELALVPKLNASKSFSLSFDMTCDFDAMVEANANVKQADMRIKIRVPTENETYIQIRAKFGYQRDGGEAWNEWLIEPQYFDGSNWTDLSGGRSWISVPQPGTLAVTFSHEAGTEAITCIMKQGDVSVMNATWDLDGSAWAAFTSFDGLEVDFTGDNTSSLAYDISGLTLTADGKNGLTKTLYDVTVTAQNGTVTGAGNYELGQSVTLSATPASGYVFDGWYIGDEKVGSETAYTLTVGDDVALTAKFAAGSAPATTTKSTASVTTTASGTDPVKTGHAAPVAILVLLAASGTALYLSKKK
jgi:uncharacterized repeat protein (TIGR02543 family)